MVAGGKDDEDGDEKREDAVDVDAVRCRADDDTDDDEEDDENCVVE